MNGRNNTYITTYAGLTQSMGAVFSVEYGNDRVIMDFGSGFNPEIKNYVKKDDNWIREKIQLGLLPKIDGLYPERYISGTDIIPYEETGLNTAVFCSHLHLDHMSNIGAVDAEIPVCMSENAVRLECLLEEIGQGVDTIGRPYSSFENLRAVQIGDIRVTPVMNSPYSYNMYGFLIETPDCKIGYTADLSLSCECPQMVQEEMEIFQKAGLNILYCDNCNFSDDVIANLYHVTDYRDIPVSNEVPEGMLSFDQHYEKISAYYLNATGLVVFNHYIREMLDADKICQWAEKAGRQAVFEPDAAYLYSCFFSRKTNVYFNGNISDSYPQWLKKTLKENTVISREDILKQPEKYFLHNSFRNIDELTKLIAVKGTYIHAEGDPFSRNEKEIMKGKVAEAGFEFRTYEDENYLQHGYPNMVRYFVNTIDPDVVIGYHGRHPERIKALSGYNLVPELYKRYRFENGKMIKEDL